MCVDSTTRFNLRPPVRFAIADESPYLFLCIYIYIYIVSSIFLLYCTVRLYC